MHKTIPFHEGIFIISYENLYAFTCITQLRNGIDIINLLNHDFFIIMSQGHFSL